MTKEEVLFFTLVAVGAFIGTYAALQVAWR